jgi:DNA-binding FrmR family transcriptional regulator
MESNHQDHKSATETHCCCHKTKVRDPKEYKDLIHRLNRIEGQIRGIKGMIEKDAYCTDVLTQVAAANAALNSFSKVLLENHIRTCVVEEIRQGQEETVDDLVNVVKKFMK